MKKKGFKFLTILLAFVMMATLAPFSSYIAMAADVVTVFEDIDISSYLSHDSFITASETGSTGASWTNYDNGGLDLEEFEQLPGFDKATQYFTTKNAEYKMYNLYAPSKSENGNVMTPTDIKVNKNITVSVGKAYEKVWFAATLHNGTSADYSVNVKYENEEAVAVPIVSSVGNSTLAGAYSWNAVGQKNIFAKENGGAIHTIGVGGANQNFYSYVYEYYIQLDSSKKVESITFGKPSVNPIYLFSMTGANTATGADVTCENENGDFVDAQVKTEKANREFYYVADFGADNENIVKSVSLKMRSLNKDIFGKSVSGSNDGKNFEPLATVVKASTEDFVDIDILSNTAYRYIKIEDCATPSILEGKITVSVNEKAKDNLLISGKISPKGSYIDGNEWYKAFDNDESTFSKAENQSDNEFVIYTGKDELYKPTKVVISSSSLSGATLWGSTDGKNYTQLVSIDENEKEIVTDRCYNYFKFTSDYNNVNEFKLYGSRNDGSYAIITNPTVDGLGFTGAELNLTYTVSPSYAEVDIEWFKDGVKIEDATGKTSYMPTEAGEYYAVLTSKVGDSVTSNTLSVALDTLPIAKEVYATGKLFDGEVLYSSYIYEDADGHEEDESVMQWYRDGVAISDATSYKYTLTSDDVGKIISFGVTPVSKNPTAKGKEVKFSFSDAVKASMYRKLSEFTYSNSGFGRAFDGDITSSPYFGFQPSEVLTITFQDGKAHSLDRFRYHPSKEEPSKSDSMKIMGTNDFVNYDVLYVAPKNHTYQWYSVDMDNFRKYKALAVTNLSTGRVAELEFYEKTDSYVEYPQEYKMPGVVSANVLDTGYFYPEKLSKVKFTTSKPSDYEGKKVYGSNDNKNWVELGTLTNVVSGDNAIEISDNGVYRYFKCDASVDYYATAYSTQYPKLTDLKFKNKAAVGGTLEAKYTFNAENGQSKDDKYVYAWYSSTDKETWSLIENATQKQYTTQSSDLGKYIKCEILPVSTEAPYGRERFSVESDFVVEALGIPQASDVKVSGVVKTGNTLSATYTFYDPNGLSESGSEYSWYKSTDGVSWNIIENENSTSYTVQEADEGSFIQFRVVPKVEKGQISGKTVVGAEATSNNATKATAPVAQNAELVFPKNAKELSVGDKVELKYTYFDGNEDEENGTVIQWKRDKDGTVVSTGKTYTITDSDIGSTFTVILQVKNNAELGDSANVVTLNFTAPCKPEVYDVVLSGSGTVGQTLTVTYKFRDENGNANIGTEVKWYSGSTELGTGLSYIVKVSDAGKSIHCKITPKTDVAPTTGDTYITNAITVAIPFTGSVGTGGSGSFGGGGGGSAGNKFTNSSVQKNEFVPAVSETPTEEETFPDIKNHWAEKEIKELAKKNIVKGNGVGYAPDNTMTRAEAMAVIIRAIGENENTPYKAELLHDVTSKDWYAGVLQAGYNAKIITVVGVSFEPNKPITRQDLCGFIMNAYISKTGKTPEAADISSFTDKDKIAAGVDMVVGQAVKLGIIKGMDDGSFSPDGNATRAQVAVMITRLLKAMGE